MVRHIVGVLGLVLMLAGAIVGLTLDHFTGFVLFVAGFAGLLLIDEIAAKAGER